MTPDNKSRHWPLIVGALGVVYGDIGTSPLYAFKEAMHGGAHDTSAILGVLSLILWSLILIVSIKYVIFIVRADHRGEGGILALLGLLLDGKPGAGRTIGPRAVAVLTSLGIFGAALLYGDGMITPAISVLSAVEGLGYATSALQPFVVPIACVVLAALFLAQRTGTGSVGRVFGPVMLVWFAFLGIVGAWNLFQSPEALHALNPLHGLNHLFHHGLHGFLVLGSVFLAVTGAEALYADLGHFGKRPIQIGWRRLVLPALALNYLGQGALVMRNPEALENPFYATVPGWALFPAILLATSATVIASQALISGAFSLTLQAMYLGYCPRVSVRHTSQSQRGQIYIPVVNWGLMIACILLVVGFRSSGALASAYGIAVTATMLLTTALFAFMSRRIWGWPLWASILFAVFFGAIELCFFTANMFKFLSGGWFAILAAVVIFWLMKTWRAGRDALYASLRPTLEPLSSFLEHVHADPPHRVKGCAIFPTSSQGVTPLALRHNLRHNKVLHETVVMISVQTELRAFLSSDEESIVVEDLGDGFYSVVARFGYMETPSIPLVVSLLPDFGVPLNSAELTYFLSRERLAPAGRSALGALRRGMFTFLARNAISPTDFFCLPANRVVEIGVQVEC